MSLFRRSSLAALAPFGDRPLRTTGGYAPTRKGALRQSVVWGAQRLRADLISQLPVDVFRTVGARTLSVPTPPVLVTPSTLGDGIPESISEWLYASQMSLDSVGNSAGIITARDALQLPAQIELVAPEDLTLQIKSGRIVQARVRGDKVDLRDLWLERQHRIAGWPVGLSPIAYAALYLAGSEAAAQFAADWFSNGAVPSAILKNSEKTLDPAEAEKHRRRFLAAVRNGEPFVTGKDWEYEGISAKAADAQFIEQMNYDDVALCRFHGVPADLVDVAVNSSTINYANISQRNLQLLIMNLGAPIKRRDDALSSLVPTPRFVKLNRRALLAMDAKTQAELYAIQITSRTRTPDQVRAIDDLEPLSDADYAQFQRLWPAAGTSEVTDAQQARAAAELIQKIYLGVGVVLSADEARAIANRAGAGLAGTYPGGA